MTQIPLFEPESSWSPPSLSSLPSWKDARRVCVDVETYDPFLKELGPSVRRGGYICGYSFAIEDGPCHYIPLRHQGGDNVDLENGLSYLRAQTKNFTGQIVGANLSYDLDFLAEEDIWFHNVEYFRDIQIAAPLIYELHKSYSLQNIAQRLGLPGKDEVLLQEAARAYGVDHKAGLHLLPGRFVGPYAEQDVIEPLRIYRKQMSLLEEQDLWEIFNLESEVLPILVKMRRKGVKIDEQRLHNIEVWTKDQEYEAFAKIKHFTNISISSDDLWKATHLEPVLNEIGIQLQRTATGKPQIQKDDLKNIDHPVAHALLHAREVNKLRTTFAHSIRRYMVNGRLHPTFTQIAVENEVGDMVGARFGRMASRDPNIQQQPARGEFARRWRSIYTPDTDLWACLDFSQQEPRWLTHFAAEMRFEKANLAVEKYCSDPKTDTYEMMKEFTGVPREQTKIIYLALCYSMGGVTLCQRLNLPTRWMLTHQDSYGHIQREKFNDVEDAKQRASEVTNPNIREIAGEEGQSILDQFNTNAPFIKQMAQFCDSLAKKRGYIRTIGGRRCRFPLRTDGINYDWTSKALNRLIQGSSADQTKAAMVALDKAGFEMQLQVHDEIDASVESINQAKEMAEIMKNCIKSSVPFKVDVEIGPSWGEIEKC